MNYYILPKNNIQLQINTTIAEPDSEHKPYISRSLYHFLINIETHLQHVDLTMLEEIQNIVNTYEYIFSNVPRYLVSVGKVKPESNIFYELIEIYYACNLNELFAHKNKITTFHLTPNHASSIFFINVVREDKADEITYNTFQSFDRSRLTVNKRFDFLFFEFDKEEYKDITQYSRNIVLGLLYIFKYQNIDGITIFKIDHIFYKVIVDVIYILSNLFEKVYIFKPIVSNITEGERYIVCKNFSPDVTVFSEEIEEQLIKLLSTKKNIYSLLTNTIPYYFVNKIEESNIVIGQQQLESLSLIINLIKNKNKDDKIEMIKRNHIQKCIQWCEKYKIPHNKFMDKTNIFLNNKYLKENMVDNEIDKYPIILIGQDQEQDQEQDLERGLDQEQAIS